jgi:hypothetical protein
MTSISYSTVDARRHATPEEFVVTYVDLHLVTGGVGRTKARWFAPADPWPELEDEPIETEASPPRLVPYPHYPQGLGVLGGPSRYRTSSPGPPSRVVLHTSVDRTSVNDLFVEVEKANALTTSGSKAPGLKRFFFNEYGHPRPWFIVSLDLVVCLLVSFVMATWVVR